MIDDGDGGADYNYDGEAVADVQTVFAHSCRISELILDHPMYRDALRRNMMPPVGGGVEGAPNAGVAQDAVPESTTVECEVSQGKICC